MTSHYKPAQVSTVHGMSMNLVNKPLIDFYLQSIHQYYCFSLLSFIISSVRWMFSQSVFTVYRCCIQGNGLVSVTRQPLLQGVY